MSNTTSPYDPTFYGQEALIVLESALGMASRVYRGYDEERKSANKGSSIEVRKPGSFTTQAGGSSTALDVSPTTTTISLSNWRQVRFALTDKELAYTGERIIAEHIRPAAFALAKYVDTQLTALYNNVPWFYDAASTIDEDEIIGARKIFRDNAGSLVEQDGLHMAIDSTVESSFLKTSIFNSAAVAGGTANQDTLMRGSLGTRYGMEFFVDQTLPTHTGGTAIISTGDNVGAASAAAYAVGVTSLDLVSLTSGETIVAGDNFSIAGDTQRYAVTTGGTVSGTGTLTVAFTPPLAVALTGSEVVTFGADNTTTTHAASYNSNLLFHRNAFAIAFAPLPEIGDGAGAKMAVITDPVSQLAIRSRLAYDDASATVKVTLDILFGVKCLDPNLAVVLRRNV